MLRVKLILVTFFLLFSTCAEARLWEAEDFRALFLSAVKEKLSWVQGKIVLERFTVEPERVEVPEGAKVELRFRGRPKLGANTALVVFEKDGLRLGQARVVGFVEAEIPVVVAKRPLARHTILGAEDITLELRPASRLPKDVLTRKEEALGKRLRMSLRAGQLVRRYALEVPPVIKRGDLVRIVAEGPGFTVTAVGEARQDGRPGEIIRVRNLESKREVFAKVVDQKTVKVNY